jgi:hypothetical protein
MAFRCITRSMARQTGASPLVLLHGGEDTIGTSFGHVLPVLARDRQVIAFEQQGFGHTANIADRPFSLWIQQTMPRRCSNIASATPIFSVRQRRDDSPAGRHPVSGSCAQTGSGIRLLSAGWQQLWLVLARVRSLRAGGHAEEAAGGLSRGRAAPGELAELFDKCVQRMRNSRTSRLIRSAASPRQRLSCWATGT